MQRSWGKRTLSYPMGKEKEGIYIHIDYAGRPQVVGEVEKVLRYDERVIRFMTTVVNKDVNVAKRAEELKQPA